MAINYFSDVDLTSNLTHLNISGLSMTPKIIIKVCKTINDNCTNLVGIHLSDLGISGSIKETVLDIFDVKQDLSLK